MKKNTLLHYVFKPVTEFMHTMYVNNNELLWELLDMTHQLL